MNCNICGFSIDYGELYEFDDWERPCHLYCLDDLDEEYDANYDWGF